MVLFIFSGIYNNFFKCLTMNLEMKVELDMEVLFILTIYKELITRVLNQPN